MDLHILGALIDAKASFVHFLSGNEVSKALLVDLPAKVLVDTPKFLFWDLPSKGISALAHTVGLDGKSHGFDLFKFFANNPFHGSNQAVAHAVSLGHKGVEANLTKGLDLLSPAAGAAFLKGTGETLVAPLLEEGAPLRQVYNERWGKLGDDLKSLTQPAPVAVVKI